MTSQVGATPPRGQGIPTVDAEPREITPIQFFDENGRSGTLNVTASRSMSIVTRPPTDDDGAYANAYGSASEGWPTTPVHPLERRKSEADAADAADAAEQPTAEQPTKTAAFPWGSEAKTQEDKSESDDLPF